MAQERNDLTPRTAIYPAFSGPSRISILLHAWQDAALPLFEIARVLVRLGFAHGWVLNPATVLAVSFNTRALSFVAAVPVAMPL
jgi:hypothetical protein